MSELMELLYDYAREHGLSRYINQEDYQQLEDLESKSLSSLCRSLSAAQAEALETYQHTSYGQKQLELEAMFQAGFEVALKLHTL
ncbi:MAG: hypothetical protein HFF84_04570 [Oscillibacter sp.]|nr:hypothetical protein [Oscillibacter sp.]